MAEIEKKTVVFQVRLLPSQAAKLAKRAAKAGQTASDYVRSVLFPVSQ